MPSCPAASTEPTWCCSQHLSWWWTTKAVNNQSSETITVFNTLSSTFTGTTFVLHWQLVAAFALLCASCWHSAPTGAAPAAQGVDDSDSRYQNVSQQRSALGLTHLVLSPHQTMALGSATQVLISSWHIQTQVSHSKKCSLVRVLSWAGSVNPLFQLGCVLLCSSEYLIRIWSMRTPCRLSENSHNKYIAQVVITGTRQYETCNFLFKKKKLTASE